MGSGYLGSKGGDGTYQAIIACMPPHDTYIEPFLGSGAIMAAKPPALRNIGADLNPEALLLAHDRIFADGHRSGYELKNCDAFHLLENFDYASAGRVLVYCDPPYLHSTRTSRHRYRNELELDDHKALLYRLLMVPAAVILSGYPDPLYDSILEGWRTIEFQAMTRGGPRTEKLWMNFPAGAVHWHLFAGKDYNDRWRISKLARRIARNYRKRPPAERLAILSAMLASESNPSPDAGANPRAPENPIFGQPPLPLKASN